MSLNDAASPYRQTAKRDFGLLHRAYRRAKMRGEYGKALEYAQMGDTMGLPVGRPAASEEIEGVGNYRFNRDNNIAGQGGQGYNFSAPSMAPVSRTGILRPGAAYGPDGAPASATLTKPQMQAPVSPSAEGGQTAGGYALTQPQQQGQPPQARQRFVSPTGGADAAPTPGTGYLQGAGYEGAPTPASVTAQQPEKRLLPEPKVAGYNLAPERSLVRSGANMYRGSQLADPAGATNSGSIGNYSFAQTRSSPLAEGGESTGRTEAQAGFSKAWEVAKTQEEKDALVERAHEMGVPMNRDAAQDSMDRRDRLRYNLDKPSTTNRREDAPRVPYLETAEGKTALAKNLGVVRRSFADTEDKIRRLYQK